MCLRSVSQAWTAFSTCHWPACNFGTQLETDRSCECFSSKCPLILEDLRTDAKLLTGNGQEEAEEQNDKLVMDLWSFSNFRIETEAFCSSLNAKEIGTL